MSPSAFTSIKMAQCRTTHHVTHAFHSAPCIIISRGHIPLTAPCRCSVRCCMFVDEWLAGEHPLQTLCFVQYLMAQCGRNRHS